MSSRFRRWAFLSLATVGAAAPTATASPASPELQNEFEQALRDFDEAHQIQNERPDRARQLFRASEQRFSSIAATGVVNGRLQFNIGNCHLQAGDVGRAILHYRRAQRLIPRDPLLADNLAVARSRCLTPIEPTRRSEFFKSVFFWHHQTASATRFRVGLVMYIAVWVLLSVRSLIRRRWITVSADSSPQRSRALGLLIVVCVIVAGACGTSVAAQRWSDRNAPEAVVTAMDVVVYKGPGTGYQRQFEQPLQPGVECTIRERRGTWWNIELVDGNAGWIQAGDAELISEEREALSQVLRP